MIPQLETTRTLFKKIERLRVEGRITIGQMAALLGVTIPAYRAWRDHRAWPDGRRETAFKVIIQVIQRRISEGALPVTAAPGLKMHFQRKAIEEIREEVYLASLAHGFEYEDRVGD